MAKVMWIQDEKQFDRSRSTHPGCMSSIFHVLDYHHWHAKILPHRKHEDLIKHTKGKKIVLLLICFSFL